MNRLVDQKRSSGQLWLTFGLCFIFGAFGGLSATLLPSYLTQLTNDTILKETDHSGAIVNAIFIYGMLAGGILLGYLGDKYGRRIAVLLSALFLSVFTLLTALASTFMALVCCRFLTGCGVGGILLTTTILLAEIWPVNKKTVILGMVSICFPVGIFSTGLITYNIAEWRSAFLIGLVPLLLLIPALFYIPESSNWLLTMKERKQHNSVLAKKDIGAIIKGSIIYGSMLIGLWAILAWLPSWIQTLVTSGGQQEVGISMMLLATGSVVSGFFSGWLCKKIDTRIIMLTCFAGCFLFAMLLFIFTTQVDILTYFYITAIAVFFGISQGVLNVYIPSLFEVENRSASTGICFNISRLFTATVVFFIGWLVDRLNGFTNALFIFSFIFIIGFIVTLFLKTKRNEPGILPAV
jgi:MFS family permease